MSAPAPRHDDPGTPRVSLGRFVAALEEAGLVRRHHGDHVDFHCPLPDHPDASASCTADWRPGEGGRAGRVKFECKVCGPGPAVGGAMLAALGLSWTDIHDDPPARPDPSSPRARRSPSGAAGSRSAARPSATPPARPRKPAAPASGPTRSTWWEFTDADDQRRFLLERRDPITEAGERDEQRGKDFLWWHTGGARGGKWAGKRCAGRCRSCGVNFDPAASVECPSCGRRRVCQGCERGETPEAVPLLRLPAVLAAVAAGHRVWLTEGAKNADDLARITGGEVTTTAPDGANGAWLPEHTAALAAARVVVVADRDPAGYRYAARVAAELTAAGASVDVVRTPIDRKGADASDHVAAGHVLEELEPVPADQLTPPEGATAAAELAADAEDVDADDVDAAGPDDAGDGADDVDEDDGGAELVDLDERRQERAGSGLPAKRKRKMTAAQSLLALALDVWDPVCSEDGVPHLVPREGPRIARPLTGGPRSVRAELARRHFEATDHVAGRYAMDDTMLTLQGIAEAGERVRLHRRVARHGDGLVLDLGDDTGRAVVITAAGWEIVDRPPVLFRRTAKTRPVPPPAPGGDLAELWSLVHVAPDDRGVAEAELVFRYFADVSHPILSLGGEAGTGKTTAALMLSSLIDPGEQVSRPSDPRDWAVRIGQPYSPVIDNLRSLTEWQSDALCMAVTGGETSFRTLHSDAGVTSFGGQQCIALTSIDLGTQAADLTTRMVSVTLRRFSDDDARIGEDDHAAACEAARPRLLGAVLDRVAAVLATLPRVRRERLSLPRLSEFARVCRALDVLDVDAGLDADRFGTYCRTLDATSGEIAHEDEVSIAVLALVAAREEAGQGAWSGTTAELHALLTRDGFRSRDWPPTPPAFGRRLSKVAGPLRAAGVEIDRSDRSSARRTLTLRPVDAADPAPVTDPTAALGDAVPVTPSSSPRASSPTTEPAATSSAAGPCAMCSGAGPWCGLGGAADEAAPCSACGEPTRVRSACGAPRHGQCRPPGGEPGPDTPPPAPKPTEAASRAAESDADAPVTEPEAKVPTRGPRPAQGRSAPREPRRGLHRYGVLGDGALTVIVDRHAGPSEALTDDEHPGDVAGVVELARRHDLEVVWVHASAHARLGLPVDTDRAPEGVDPWHVTARGEPGEVVLALPRWLDGAWSAAGTARELAEALARFEAAVGMRPVTAPAATAGALLGMLHNRTNARPLINPEWLPDRTVTFVERPLSWARELTEQEAAGAYVIGLDKHGAYPGVFRDLRLGMGTPDHRPAGAWDPKVPGRHRVTNVQPPPDRDPRLPDPLVGVLRDGEWRCTETLAYAAQVGVRFDVIESYVWPDAGFPLRSFSERVRLGLDALDEQRGAGEPGADLARAAMKEVYAAVGGMLSSRAREILDNPGKLFRPDWTGSVVARGRVNILRNVDKAMTAGGAAPFAANVDELFYVTTDPDPAAIGLPLGDRTGQWAVKTEPVALADVAEAVRACVGRRRQPGPSPLLRRLAELRGSA